MKFIIPELTTSKKSVFTISLSILYLFVFFRPLVIISGYSYTIAGLNILEVFSIVTSYALILSLLNNIEKIRLNSLYFLILLFIFYCLLTLLWGSNLREMGRIVLPFLTFFTAATVLDDKKQLKILIFFLLASYTLFIFANLIGILVFKVGSSYEFRRGIERFSGLTGGSHSLAHTMFIFSPIYVLYRALIKKTSNLNLINLLLILLLFGSLFCIYKSFTRTVYVGVSIFWTLYFFGISKKKLLYLIISLCIFTLMFYDKILPAFQKDVLEPLVSEKNIYGAGSGRLEIWNKSLEIYSKISLEQKIIGIGLGKEILSSIQQSKITIATTHNDFLGLLVETGIIGLFLYISILFIILKDIILWKADKNYRYIFLSLLISVIIMNILSNSYISRVELAQFFWLFVGIFYAIKEKGILKNAT